MSDALPLYTPPAPTVLREHQVHTLPSLQMAIADLVAAAGAIAKGPIALADFDPKDGVMVSLNQDAEGNLFVAFRRKRA